MKETRFSDLCKFTPKQWIATEAADRYRFALFGGSRGPGKSYWLRWHSIRQLISLAGIGITSAVWGLFCETYPELQDRQINKIAKEFPPWLGTLKETRTLGLGFYLAPQYGSGVLALRNLDDASKYKGAEFVGLSIDEITRIPMSKFDILRGSMRWPGVERTQFTAATNPDGRYAEWVRQLWVERKFEGEGFKELAPLASEFHFVPALPSDNPNLSQEYWNDLETQPTHRRKAWLGGDWYAGSEGVVYDEFGDDNITQDAFNPALPYELAFDDGYIDPRVILFIQRTGTHIHVFDELYETKTLDAVGVRHTLERIMEMYGLTIPEGWALMSLADASTWLIENGAALPEIAIGGTESVKLMRQFREANITARGGTHSIVEGINHMRALVRDGRGYRSLQVSPKCHNLIREMMQGYQYPTNSTRRDNELPEDKDNHAVDALRYWCWLRGK